MSATAESRSDGGEPERGQVIVIMGGFLAMASLYSPMRSSLERLTGRPVLVVDTRFTDWIPSVVPAGWLHLLHKLDRTVRTAARVVPGGRVTLIAHSAGGVLSRLYLSPEPFLGQVFGGLRWVGRLITLGSPHYHDRRWIHGGMMARWVDDRVPGAFFAPQVEYCSVAGKLVQGDRQGSRAEHRAYSIYRQIVGDGDAWGDGLVPVASALLAGSRQVTLEGVGHYTGFGDRWYGTEDTIRSWWQAC